MKYVAIAVQLFMLAILVVGWALFGCGVIQPPADAFQKACLLGLHSFLMLLVDPKSLVAWIQRSQNELQKEELP